MMHSNIKIIEVGPRDGLQNETSLLPVEYKVELINQLSEAGLSHIEAGSFVSPKWVPQMASSDEVFKQINRTPSVTYAALTPNLQGLQSAIESGVDEIAVFTAASELFCRTNINCSIEESINRFKPLMSLARQHNIKVRGYVSCIMGCPYEGDIPQKNVLETSRKLLELGCYEISLGDTIGVGTANRIKSLLTLLKNEFSTDQLAVHFHDTYGQALTNIYASLEQGISTIDTSVAGLGGCPYAKGASGNMATEDVIYMLHGLGVNTGVNLEKLIAAGNYICNKLNRQNGSKVALASNEQ